MTSIAARNAGWSFSPLDHKLGLGAEGYSPRLLRKIVRQGGKSVSYADASGDLGELLNMPIGAKHVERLTERIGKEWVQARDRDVEAFKQDKLPRLYAQKPQAAVVMLDGGRLQTRSESAASGVHDPAWREPKYGCLITLDSKQKKEDPQPEPPSKFLDRKRVAKLVQEIQSRHARDTTRAPAKDKLTSPKLKTPKKKTKARVKRKGCRLVLTAIATMLKVTDFGYLVATEVYRRNLDLADRKGCVCDGQPYNWTICEEFLKPLGFIAILDFLHLLTYLYSAARAAAGKDELKGWRLYQLWMRQAWAGKVEKLINALEVAAIQMGQAPKNASEQDPRRIIETALRYVKNNRERMDYPRYRKLGLPISSAPVESLVKQFNRRVKGSEKFWCENGAESVLEVRAAYLSQDGRAERLWTSPRPYQRAVGMNRLCAVG